MEKRSRKVTLAATQAGNLHIPERFNCLSSTFDANPSAVVKECVIPTVEHYINLLSKCEKSPDAEAMLALTGEGACGLGNFTFADKSFFNELVILSAPAAEERFSKMAKDKNVYVAACYYKQLGGKNYNVTSIFAPDGLIKGAYKKTHLPVQEMWVCEDGDDLNVIELEFGKIGVLICYDLFFAEAASVLAMKGAEVIMHPTNGDFGGFTRQTRANDNCVFLLTAMKYVNGITASSSVIDRSGNILVQTNAQRDSVCSYTVDLNERTTEPEGHFHAQLSGITDVWERKLLERNPYTYSILSQPAKRLRVPDAKEQDILREKMRKVECHW